jgi:hypothetical protein
VVEGDGVYERIVKNNTDGIILTKDRVIVFANQAAADIYGSGDPTEMEGGFLPSPSALYILPLSLSSPWGISTFLTVIAAIFSGLSSQKVTLTVFNSNAN